MYLKWIDEPIDYIGLIKKNYVLSSSVYVSDKSL